MNGTDEADGLLGAVLRVSGSPCPHQLLGSGGPILVTSLEGSKTVLTSPDDFVTPFDVSRNRVRRHRPSGGVRSKETPPLSAGAARTGAEHLASELTDLDIQVGASAAVDALDLVRIPVARSTAAALLPAQRACDRSHLADLTLAWIDALGPVIAAPRPPRSWTPTRRTERRSRMDLVEALSRHGVEDPVAVSTALAAGVQVPVAASAWCLVQLAARPELHAELQDDPRLVLPVVWEVLRLFPPTWLLPRVTTKAVVIQGMDIPAYRSVVVSPVALGQLVELVPGPEDGESPRSEFDPTRWRNAAQKPGAWLPFGAGQHACPGRNLGLEQLRQIVDWSRRFDLRGRASPGVDQTRGLTPRDSRIDLRRRTEPSKVSAR